MVHLHALNFLAGEIKLDFLWRTGGHVTPQIDLLVVERQGVKRERIARLF